MVSVYRADARLLLERGSLHSAGTVLYESAKQCLNASPTSAAKIQCTLEKRCAILKI